jgi:O-antigen ligase
LTKQEAGREAAASTKWLPWVLVALAPAALALTTWEPAGPQDVTQGWFRLYGVAAAVIEMGVILYAILAGADPLRPVAALPFWAKTALAVLIGIGVYTAVIVAPDELRGLSWTFLSIVHLLFGLAAAGLARGADSHARSGIWNAVLAGSCAYLIILIAFVAVALSRPSMDWQFFGLGGTNIRQVAFYSVVGSGAALGLALAQSDPGMRAIYVGNAAVMLALSFWSGTRGALLAILVSFAVAAVLLPAFRTVRAWAMLAIVFAGGALLSLAGPTPNPLYGIVRLKASSAGGTPDVSSGRFDMWSGTWSAVLDRPFIGHGAGQYFAVVHDKLGGFNHPHNIVLQVLFHWGFVGAACYFALAMLVAWRAFVALRSPQPADAPALLVGISLLTMSLYEGTLFHTYPSMMIAFALALIIAPPRGAVRIAR